MNPNEQRLAIATACGWIEIHEQWIDNIANAFSKELVGKHTDNQWTYCEIPDFCNSLDAMHEAEATLTTKQAHEMDRILQRIVFKQSNTDENWASGPGSIHTLIWHATAAQRADAFCQVIKSTPPAAES